MKIAQIKNNMLRRIVISAVLPTLMLFRVVPVWMFCVLLTPLAMLKAALEEGCDSLWDIYREASYETRLLVAGFKMIWAKSSGSDE